MKHKKIRLETWTTFRKEHHNIEYLRSTYRLSKDMAMQLENYILGRQGEILCRPYPRLSLFYRRISINYIATKRAPEWALRPIVRRKPVRGKFI